MYKKWFLVIVICLAVFYIYHPGRHAAYYYEHVPNSQILHELVPNNNIVNTNLKHCSYELIIDYNEETDVRDVAQSWNYHNVLPGGEYCPSICNSAYKTAIIIVYRDREKQLNIFLNYMHYFLQAQSLCYRIFVVEQYNNLAFNRAKLFNIGASRAMELNYTCLVLQDVDLLPLNKANLYACSKQPRHLSSCLDTFRFNLPYKGLFGGAIAILSEQFKKVNGFSNLYVGWGGEDDDLLKRIQVNEMDVIRFSPEVSRYTMLYHKRQEPNEDRRELLNRALTRMLYDGLNSLKNDYKIQIEPLYTHILALW